MMKPEEKWGQGFYDTLSRDLRQSLPDAKGFSVRNLQCMRQFYELFPMLSIPQQAVAQTESGIAPQLAAQIVSIPWGHICLIMNRCDKDQRKALFYVNQTVLNNWSRAMLLNFVMKFESETKPLILPSLQKHPEIRLVRFRSREEIDSHLASLP